MSVCSGSGAVCKIMLSPGGYLYVHKNSLGVCSAHTYPMCPCAVEVCSVKCGGSRVAWLGTERGCIDQT